MYIFTSMYYFFIVPSGLLPPPPLLPLACPSIVIQLRGTPARQTRARVSEPVRVQVYGGGYGEG